MLHDGTASEKMGTHCRKYEFLYVQFWSDKFRVRQNLLNINEKCVVLEG